LVSKRVIAKAPLGVVTLAVATTPAITPPPRATLVKETLKLKVQKKYVAFNMKQKKGRFSRINSKEGMNMYYI
jgi:hypothetical protein